MSLRAFRLYFTQKFSQEPSAFTRCSSFYFCNTGKEDTVPGGWHVGRSCLTHSFVWTREEAPHFVARDTIILIDQSLTFTFEKCMVQMGFLPWENRLAFLGDSKLQQSRATHPKMHAGCFSVSIIHRTLTWTPEFLTRAQM